MLVYLLLLIAISLTVTGEVLLTLGMNSVRAVVGEQRQSDDITLLALRWHGPSGTELPSAD